MTQPVERDFPDIERLLGSVFAPLLGGAEHVGNTTPPDLEAVLPFVRIIRMGGARTTHVDFPVVDLAYLDVDGADGMPAVSRLINHLLSKPPPHPSIDWVACDPGPRELPWGDSDSVRHWGATLFLETRKVRLAPLP